MTVRVRSERHPVMGEWPIIVVILCLLAGLGVLFTGHWRRGSFVIGVAVALAALLRGVLPTRLAGLLAVRSRTLDTIMLTVAGLVILVLTFFVPGARYSH